MIKINASKRLVVMAAKANPKALKTYFKSLGIKVGEQDQNGDGYVRFWLPKAEFKKAVTSLTRQYGDATSFSGRDQNGMRWRTKEGFVTLTKFRGAGDCLISLMDRGSFNLN